MHSFKALSLQFQSQNMFNDTYATIVAEMKIFSGITD